MLQDLGAEEMNFTAVGSKLHGSVDFVQGLVEPLLLLIKLGEIEQRTDLARVAFEGFEKFPLGVGFFLTAEVEVAELDIVVGEVWLDGNVLAKFLLTFIKLAEFEIDQAKIEMQERESRVDGESFLELEERSKTGERSSTVNSLSVYEFNEAGKLRHLDIYLQMEMLELPDPETLKKMYA